MVAHFDRTRDWVRSWLLVSNTGQHVHWQIESARLMVEPDKTEPVEAPEKPAVKTVVSLDAVYYQGYSDALILVFQMVLLLILSVIVMRKFE